jgi:hypothetical protein
MGMFMHGNIASGIGSGRTAVVGPQLSTMKLLHLRSIVIRNYLQFRIGITFTELP